MTTQPYIFDDLQRLRQRQRASQGNFSQHDFLFCEAAERLADRLDDIRREFPLALELGSRTGQLRRILGERGGIQHLIQTDTNFAMSQHNTGLRVVCHEEYLPFANENFDIALSVLGLSAINDLPGTFAQLKRALKPDGLFLAMVYGGRTLHELRDVLARATLEIEGGATAYISPFIDVRDAGSLLQRAGFSLPVIDSECITVSYENAFALMHDLRKMGEGNALHARRKTFAKRSVFMRAAELYQQDYSDEEGRIIATFELVTLTAWTPHISQQQPAKRGSGKINLNEALKSASPDS
ncbi:MAG: methyltransferase domain-containing protein [Alphaproteobacteria bacterium]|nr:methyltransferase domain-containing protein [Alphaproteobacteria bacterium]